MKLIESFLKNNNCYKANVNKSDGRYSDFQKNGPKGLMLHSVGCSQPKASVFINSWNDSSTQVCVHAFIDGNTGEVFQTLPWNYRAWHCGSGSKGSANNTHVGVEMCEPACIRYTGGSTFTCSDLATAKASAKRTYEAAVELFAMLCKKYQLDPMKDGVIISHREGHTRGIASNHGDPEHLWNGLKMGYTMDTFRKSVKAKLAEGAAPEKEEQPTPSTKGIQAFAFKNLSEADVVKMVGPLATANMKVSGVLASVTLAQFILESGYGKTELAQNANNCFGMKKSLSGNTWSGSSWDGKSIYTKKTKEQNPDGSVVTITADFRQYACVEDSIADHSAYLLGAKNGDKLRYAGIKGMKDYKAVAKLIKAGGYATDLTYVEKLCSIIERWNLTQYDTAEVAAEKHPEKLTSGYYRVRKTWKDSKTQVGAYKVLTNAKAKADENPGYFVFDESGNAFYPVKETVKEDKPATPTPVAPMTPAKPVTPGNDGNTTVIGYGRLRTVMNIRKAPSTDAERITTYKTNTIVQILQKCSNGWLRIKTDSGFAYVSNADNQYVAIGSRLYVVRTGDSLWKIAAEKLGNGTKFGEIKKLNGLTSNTIYTSQKLILP